MSKTDLTKRGPSYCAPGTTEPHGLCACRPDTGTGLSTGSPSHVKAAIRRRVEFCRTREAWTDDECHRSMFSDESQFCITTDDHCVWRCREERTNPANGVERHTSITPSIMVWGALGHDFMSSLVVTDGRTSLTSCVCTSSQPETAFQQDNARPYMAHVSMDCPHPLVVLRSFPSRTCVGSAWTSTQALRQSAGSQGQLQQLWGYNGIQQPYDSLPQRISACTQAGATL